MLLYYIISIIIIIIIRTVNDEINTHYMIWGLFFANELNNFGSFIFLPFKKLHVHTQYVYFYVRRILWLEYLSIVGVDSEH